MKIYTILIIVLMPMLVSAQYDFDEAYFYPEAMQEDLDMFVKVVKHVHPDPWRFVSERKFDAMVVATRRELETAHSIYDYMSTMQPLLAAMGDAHTRMELPEEFYLYAKDKEPLIPIKCRVEDERLFLVDELKAFRTMSTGSEVLSINAIPAADIIASMRACVTVDGENTSYSDYVIAKQFPLVFHRAVVRAPVFSVKYLTADGAEKTVELKALTGEEIERTGKSLFDENKSLQWTNEATQKGEYVWLRVPTLSRTEIAAQGIRPERLIKETAKMLQDEKAKVLIIDIRGTSGMEMHLVEKIYRLIAQSPYRALSEVHFKAIDAPYGIDADSFPSAEMSELLGRTVQEGESYVIDEKDEILQLISPNKNAFGGKVFVLTDGGTQEAAVALAVMLRRDKRGMIMGSETGGNASSFCASKSFSFSTPHTGLRFSVPLVSYDLERGSNPASETGVKPDLAVYFAGKNIDEQDALIERDLRMFLGEWND